MGRLTALQKPAGGVRGIVCGDIVRRLVAQTIAQSMSAAVQAATSPFQYALTTKSGGECVAHAIKSLTDLNSQATVLTIDGISAYDSISRASMLNGLSNVNGGYAVLPFVLKFYTQPSEYHWMDDCGRNNVIHQGEGGEQGNALMPMLYSLGQHAVLQATQDALLLGEHLFAYLDDIYIVCLPERVTTIHKFGAIIGTICWNSRAFGQDTSVEPRWQCPSRVCSIAGGRRACGFGCQGVERRRAPSPRTRDPSVGHPSGPC